MKPQPCNLTLASWEHIRRNCNRTVAENSTGPRIQKYSTVSSTYRTDLMGANIAAIGAIADPEFSASAVRLVRRFTVSERLSTVLLCSKW